MNVQGIRSRMQSAPPGWDVAGRWLRGVHTRHGGLCHAVILVLLIGVIALPPRGARAAWGGWEDLGGILLEAPNCVTWGANRIDCFARGTDRAMYHRWWDGSTWGGWEDLGGIILEAPNCVSWSVNRIDCFARGTD
jgi:Repeat of unknown function (DUF346)